LSRCAGRAEQEAKQPRDLNGRVGADRAIRADRLPAKISVVEVMR